MADLTRRTALGLGLAAGITALTAGCSTPGTTSVNAGPLLPAADGPIRLKYWAWLKDLQKVCDVWNASHPDVQVDAVWIPGGNSGGYQKLYSALAAGGGPDIGQVEMRTVPEFLLVNGLVDLRRYGADDIAADYNDTLWNQVSFVDGVYGIPQDSGPMGLYYRPDMLEQVGAQPPATWDEWAEVAAEIRGLDAYLECFALNDASWFAAMATQAGASWFTVDGDEWSVHMTDDATLQVAEFWDRAIDDDLVTVAYGQYSPPWYAAAANDRIAGAVGASWGDALMQSIAGAEGKWRVAPMPRWGAAGAETGYGSTFQGGSTAAVMASSRYPRESLEFLHWMTTSPEGIDAMIQYSGIGWSPNDDYIGEQRQQPSEFFGGQNYNEEVFVPAAREQNTEWEWWPLTQQSFNILSDGFRQKTAGVTLVDSIAQAEDDIVRAFRNKGLSIRKASA